MLLLMLACIVTKARAQLTYSITNGAVTITGYSGSGGTLLVPATFDGLPVTTIGAAAFESQTGLNLVVLSTNITGIQSGAFADCTGLTGITLPDQITDIGSGAFSNCTSLASVILPGALTRISDGTFAECGNLTSVVIPPGVTNIGNGAFADCSWLASVDIPAGVTTVGTNAFYYCTLMTNLTIEDGVKTIAESAFEGCVSLPTIGIPDSVTNIGPAAFADCFSLSQISVAAQNPSYRSVDGILFDKPQTVLIQCPATFTGGYDVPTNVISIGDSAFFGCRWLTGITFPEGLTDIGNRAFDSCMSLTNVSIPANVTSIGDVPFRACVNLAAISVAPTNPAYSSSDGVLFDKGQTQLIQCPLAKTGDYFVPETVNQIGQWSFAYCSLSTIVVDGNVQFVWGDAFEGCPSLTGVYFRGDAPTLDSGIFFGDPQLFVYYLPGKTGWTATFAGQPAELWMPELRVAHETAGVGTNGFGFLVIGDSNATAVVEATMSVQYPMWVPVWTNTLPLGLVHFSDPGWANSSSRFYRVKKLQ